MPLSTGDKGLTPGFRTLAGRAGRECLIFANESAILLGTLS